MEEKSFKKPDYGKPNNFVSDWSLITPIEQTINEKHAEYMAEAWQESANYSNEFNSVMFL